MLCFLMNLFYNSAIQDPDTESEWLTKILKYQNF